MATHDGDEREKVWTMIRDIQVAMLTSADEGRLRSRPMAAVDTEFGGTLWFFTRADSHKVIEVAEESQVGLSYADPKKQNYVSLSGTARLVRDAGLVDQHWTESMRVWFPKGKADPQIALLRVDVDYAEYWDAPSSTMLHLYGYAKARLTGASPHPGDHAQVDLT
jgi:general stress protein 26